MDDDDDIPQLSSDTLQFLKEFKDEKDARSKQFEDLKSQSELDFQHGKPLSMDTFAEDWNASQFWYNDETARLLAHQLLGDMDDESAIAVVSAPSVYVQLINILRERPELNRPKLRLLEYDMRFEVFGSDFVPFDFQHPFRLPSELKGTFDRIICDPPFLSEDCQTKTALAARYLARTWSPTSESNRGVRLIVCTGERMETTVCKLYGSLGLKTTSFEPQHSHGLSNEFRCYANFECEEWTWR